MPTVVFTEGDLPASSRRVFEALGDLAAEVPIDRVVPDRWLDGNPRRRHQERSDIGEPVMI